MSPDTLAPALLHLNTLLREFALGGAPQHRLRGRLLPCRALAARGTTPVPCLRELLPARSRAEHPCAGVPAGRRGSLLALSCKAMQVCSGRATADAERQLRGAHAGGAGRRGRRGGGGPAAGAAAGRGDGGRARRRRAARRRRGGGRRLAALLSGRRVRPAPARASGVYVPGSAMGGW